LSRSSHFFPANEPRYMLIGARWALDPFWTV
jgi:hypothetical protein